MRFLLDTHVFLRFIGGDAKLPAEWRDTIRQPHHEVYLSVVSLWEAVIKYHLGKLPLPEPPEHYLPIQRVRHQIAELPLDEARWRIRLKPNGRGWAARAEGCRSAAVQPRSLPPDQDFQLSS